MATDTVSSLKRILDRRERKLSVKGVERVELLLERQLVISIHAQ